MRSSWLGRAVAATVFVCCLVLAACDRNADAQSSCPNSTFPWQGASKARDVSVRSPTGGAQYAATIFRPANRHRYPGRRPAVIALHGGGGYQCGLWWAARELAGHGYVAVALGTTGKLGDWRTDVDALRGSLRFLGSHRNPYRRYTNPRRVGLLGHSAGTGPVSLMQGRDRRVKAIVAMDDLVPAFGKNLPGGGATVHPRVPGLGLASEHEYPASKDPERMKKGGYSAWRAANVPSMEVILRGMEHLDFTATGTEAQRHNAAHYMLAWFDRWLGGRRSATQRLLARRVLGQPIDQVLSPFYRSAADLPGRLKTADLVARLTAH